MRKDIFDKASLSARDQVDGWENIRKTIGDSIAGVFLGWWTKPAEGQFKAQIGIALRQEDGKVLGTTVTDTDYMRQRIAQTQVGDSVGLRYEGDKDTGNLQPAKIIKFYNPDLEERNKKGVKSEGIAPTEDARPTDGTASEEDPF